MTGRPHSQTAAGAVERRYSQTALAVDAAARELQTYAGLILRDLDENRVPSVRGILDAALRLSRDAEVMHALSALPSTPD
jgi:hypothetical protein